MHGSATAAAVPGLLPEELRHHPLRVVALRDRVPVAAMGAHDVVVGADRGDGADRDRLLTEIRMEIAADIAEPVLLDGSLLEPADRRGGLVHPTEEVGCDLGHSDRAPSSADVLYAILEQKGGRGGWGAGRSDAGDPRPRIPRPLRRR